MTGVGAVGRVAAMIAVLTCQVAEAQIGGLVKKVKQKVAAAPADAGSSGPEPTFDAVILELDSTRVAALVAGISAGRAVLEGGAGGPSLGDLTTRRNAALDTASAIQSAQGSAIDQYRDRRRAVDECRREAFGAIEDRGQKQYQQRVMSDPSLQQTMLALGQQLAAATARGDSASVANVHRQMMQAARVGATAADTVAIDQQCGTVPAAPAALARLDSLDGERARLDREIRALEAAAVAAELEASGMSARAFAMARERAQMFLAGGARGGFSATERQALAARRADLEPLL